MLHPLAPLAGKIATLLKQRGETISVVEGSAGGLLSAALLSQAGASAYYLGGSVVYTAPAFKALTRIDPAILRDRKIRSSTTDYATLMAEDSRLAHGAVWGLCESGASGPTGNGYGDPAGHTALAVVGPQAATKVVRTGSDDRIANMQAFAEAGLALLLKTIERDQEKS